MNTARRASLLPLLLSCVGTVIACGSDGDGTSPPASSDGGSNRDAAQGVDGGGDGAAPIACPRPLKGEDAQRFVVVSHPFAADGKKDNRFEVLTLDSAGVVARTGTTFAMGNSFDGTITFTPDGHVGLVPQEDGSVGVFALTDDGKVTVLQPAFKDGGFYAEKVYIDPTGNRAFILDSQVQKNGGGIYEAAIGCDGKLGPARKLAEAEGIGDLGFFHKAPSRALTGTAAAFGQTDADTFVVDLAGAAPTTPAKTKVFTEQTIATSIAVSADDKVGVIACGNSFAGGNQVAVMALGEGTLTKKTILTVEAPTVAIASPFNNAFFLASADPDAFRVLSYDAANAAAPVAVKGLVTYKFGKPELPSVAVLIERGKLRGRVVVAENTAVRQVQFTPDGNVDDTAQFVLGQSTDLIVGGLGVTAP